MRIVQVKNYPTAAYFQKTYNKTRIALHHTISRTASSAIEWWKEKRADKIGTAYIIDKDGTIYNTFDDKCYAWQFGLQSSIVPNRIELETTTIGIEIVNEGALTKNTDGTFKDCYGSPYKGNVIESPFRGEKYWAEYTAAQYTALSELLQYLSKKHNIEIKLAKTLTYDIYIPNSCTVFTHTNVRKDKTDVSPAFVWDKITL